jgi:hypothetical protein
VVLQLSGLIELCGTRERSEKVIGKDGKGGRRGGRELVSEVEKEKKEECWWS